MQIVFLDNFFLQIVIPDNLQIAVQDNSFANCCSGQFYYKLSFPTTCLQIVVQDNCFANCCSQQVHIVVLNTFVASCHFANLVRVSPGGPVGPGGQGIR